MDRPHSSRDIIPISGYKEKRRWWEGKGHSAGLRCIWTSGTPGQATDLPFFLGSPPSLAPHLPRHAPKTAPSLLPPYSQLPTSRIQDGGAMGRGRVRQQQEQRVSCPRVLRSRLYGHSGTPFCNLSGKQCVCPTPGERHASAPGPGRGAPGPHCTWREASCAHAPPLDPPDPRSKQTPALWGEASLGLPGKKQDKKEAPRDGQVDAGSTPSPREGVCSRQGLPADRDPPKSPDIWAQGGAHFCHLFPCAPTVGAQPGLAPPRSPSPMSTCQTRSELA